MTGSAWCVLATEILSACHFLTFWGALISWLPPAIAAMIFALRTRAPLRITIPHWMTALMLLLALISLCIAIAYPTNNYDSLTYHMARVAHWIQNGSIAYYPTHVGRQLIMPPFAEYVILQLQLLTGGDRLANTVQLFFFIGCITNVSLIAGQLGGTPQQQLRSGFFTCLIPMALLQSNTTQNDIVAAYFVLAFVYFTIRLQKENTPLLLIMAGFSLGLAWLTKGTTYLFTLPFVAWYSIPLIKTPLRETLPRILRYALIPALALLINSGFFYRNWMATGSPLGPATREITNEGKSFKSLLLVAVKNGLNHLPVNAYLKEQLVRRSAWLGIDANDPKYSYTPIYRMAEGFSFDEDYAQNFPHILFILLALGYFLSRKTLYMRRMNNYKLFVLTSLACTLLFCIELKWQPWGNRLETTLFMLFSIFLAFEWDMAKRWMKAFGLILMMSYGLTAFLFSTHHPLLPLKNSIFHRPYNSFIYPDALLECKDQLDMKPYTKLGIYIGGDSPDYPYYKLLARSGGRSRVLEHVLVSNASAAYDKGFIPDAIISIEGSRVSYTVRGHTYYRSVVFSDGLALFEQR